MSLFARVLYHKAGVKLEEAPTMVIEKSIDDQLGSLTSLCQSFLIYKMGTLLTSWVSLKLC